MFNQKQKMQEHKNREKYCIIEKTYYLVRETRFLVTKNALYRSKKPAPCRARSASESNCLNPMKIVIKKKATAIVRFKAFTNN